MKLLSSKKIAVVLLLALIIAPFGSLMKPFSAKQAQAQGLGDLADGFIAGVAGCAAAGWLLKELGEEFAIAGVSVPSEEGSASLKEEIVDCILTQVVNVIIEDMMRSLTKWVQSGFKGNPVFVTRLNKHLKDVADETAGAFILNSAPYLCSPFRLEIQYRLFTEYKDSRRNIPDSCSFTESVENVERFLEGDFSAGGWDTWFEAYADPVNNPYGAYNEALKELSIRVSSATGQAEKEVSLGNGFLSQKRQTCYLSAGEGNEGPPQSFNLRTGETISEARQRENLGTGGEVTCDEAEIVTPGSFIEKQIANQYNIPAERLTFADELNEMIAAVVTYLVKNILQGAEGLAGYREEDFKEENVYPTLPTLDGPVIPPTGGNDSVPDDTEPAGPPGPSMCFERRGVFLVPREGAATAGFQFGVPANVSYDRIELELDVKNTGWPADREGWPAMLFWLVRDGNKNLYGYSKINAPGTSYGRTFKLVHGIGVSHGFKETATAKMDFPDGATYRYRYVYDAEDQSITLRAIDRATGATVRALGSVPTVPGINTGNEKFRIGIGYNETELNPKERPMYGWEYSNLKVSFITEGDAIEDCVAPSPWSGNAGRDKPADDDTPPTGGGGDDGDDTPLF